MSLATPFAKVTFEPLSIIRRYFGDKQAFYVSYISHYTVFLLLAAIPCLCCACAQLASRIDNDVIVALCLWMAIWTSVHAEMWKRKATEIAWQWDLTNFENEEKPRVEYRRDLWLNKLGKADTYTDWLPQLLKVLTSVALGLFFIGLSAGATALSHNYRLWFGCLKPAAGLMDGSSQGRLSPGSCSFIHSSIANLFNSGVVVSIDFVWEFVAVWLAKWENHELDSTHEDRILFKMFWVVLCNNLIPLLYVIFVLQDPTLLFWQAFQTMVLKQLGILFKDIALPFGWWQYKKRRWVNPRPPPDPEAPAAIDPERSADQRYVPAASPVSWRFSVTLKRTLASILPVSADPSDPASPATTQPLPQKPADIIGLCPKLEVQENVLRVPRDEVVLQYVDMVTSYMFVTCFSCICPLVPLVALGSNLLQIHGELYVNLHVARQTLVPPAGGVLKAWAQCTEIIGYLATIINVCVLMFTASNSVLQQMSYENKIWAFVIIEHVLLLLKYVLSVLIPDRPSWVVQAMRQSASKPKDSAKKQTATPAPNARRAERRTSIFASASPSTLLSPNTGRNSLFIDRRLPTPGRGRE